ncbi:MAG: squalene/phytoene synthase family protein [Pseudobdellovibrio sp.]
MNITAIYQQHLEKVSRSFSFCIPRLNSDLRHWVSLSYLLFRVVDTIEDSVWESSLKQLSVFQQLIEFIQNKPEPYQVELWMSSFPDNIPDCEKKLLADSAILINDLHTLSQPIYEIVSHGMIDMIRGMIYFCGKTKTGLKNIYELNQYCFFVAGIVGELLTKLVMSRSNKEFEKTAKDEGLILKSHHFGIFLQKINILKDQSKDESEGRFFVPEREIIKQSLKVNCENAFAYIVQLPKESRDYKLFCSYSFFLGLFSLSWIENSWVAKIAEKIPRDITEKFLKNVENCIDDNQALEKLFQSYLPGIKKWADFTLPIVQMEENDFSWFDNSYSGTLNLDHLQNLGLIN